MRADNLRVNNATNFNRFENGVDGRNLRRKRRRSTRRRHECSSAESDSCDYSYDDDEGEATARQRRAKKRQEKDRNKETEDNSRKEEEDDDDQSVSDDSLEVIVVKKSLEKKSEKVVSGRRSKTPRECTKETRVTKMHTRSSTKTSRSGSKSKTPDDDDPGAADRDKSPSKEEKPSRVLAEEAGDDEGRLESRYQGDATDSTSQETVERVVVTAMVHKNQAPDTPRSTLETAREKRTIEIERTKGTSRDASENENEISSRKMDTEDGEERSPQGVQKSPDGKIRDGKAVTTIHSGAKDARKEGTTDDKVQGKKKTNKCKFIIKSSNIFIKNITINILQKRRGI